MSIGIDIVSISNVKCFIPKSSILYIYDEGNVRAIVLKGLHEDTTYGACIHVIDSYDSLVAKYQE